MVTELRTEDWLRAELVAVGVFDNVVDLYLTLEDLEGDRLGVYGDDFIVEITINAKGLPNERPSWHPFAVINQTDDGILTLHGRKVFSRSVSGQKLTAEMAFSFIHAHTVATVDFDLSIAETVEPVAVIWDTPIIEPHLHNIPLADLKALDILRGNWECIADSGMYISSIGIIEGNLHVQIYAPAPLNYSLHMFMRTVPPHDGIVLGTAPRTVPPRVVSFDIENGNIAVGNAPVNIGNTYLELVFAGENRASGTVGLNLNVLERYVPSLSVVRFETPMRWSESFEVTAYGGSLAAENLDIQARGFTIREVRLSPFSVLVVGETPGIVNMIPHVPVRIHTTDGVIPVFQAIPVLRTRATDEFGNNTTEFSTVVNIFGFDHDEHGIPQSMPIVRDAKFEALDLSTVVALEIAGEIIPDLQHILPIAFGHVS